MEKAHKRLDVWLEAISLVKMVYLETQNMPIDELYGLTSQMRRAAVSIPSNIAEGAARKGGKESAQFFNIARGSISELDTQIILCTELKLLGPSAVSHLTSTLEKVDSLLNGLIRYRLKRKETIDTIR